MRKNVLLFLALSECNPSYETKVWQKSVDKYKLRFLRKKWERLKYTRAFTYIFLKMIHVQTSLLNVLSATSFQII